MFFDRVVNVEYIFLRYQIHNTLLHCSQYDSATINQSLSMFLDYLGRCVYDALNVFGSFSV